MAESLMYKLNTQVITEVKQHMTQKVVEFCALDVRPMETIAGDGFIRLAQYLVSLGATYGNFDVSTVLPHPTTVSRHIHSVKMNLHEKMFPIIDRAMKNGECSASTDMWTEDYKKRSFVTMTVHFFGEKFILNKRVLFTSLFEDEEKTGENIKAAIIEKFKGLGYDPEYLKKTRWVTDQGSNIICALKKPYTRDNCRTHLISTILRNTFDSDDIALAIPKLLRSCKNIVKYLKQSGKSNWLSSAVLQECETRWNTKLAMLESILKQHWKIMSILSKDQRKRWAFNISLANELVRFLTPFKEATKSLEGDTYCTANKILLWWSRLSTHLNTTIYHCKPLKKLVRVAKKFFKQKFTITMDNKIACLLDPRYRFLKMLPEAEREEVFREVKNLLDELPKATDEFEQPPSKKGRFALIETASEDFMEIDEFERYMRTADFSQYNTESKKKHLVELFWNDNEENFPKLFRLAKTRLNIPAASATSERVFSSAGRTYNGSSTNLKPELLDDLLFIKYNFSLLNESST